MEKGERMSYSIAAVSLAATMKDHLPHFWSETHTPNYCTLSDSFKVYHFVFKKWKKRKSEKQFARVSCFLDVKLAASVQTWTFRLILQKNWKLAEHKFLELRRMQEISGTKLSPDILNLVIIWLACMQSNWNTIGLVWSQVFFHLKCKYKTFVCQHKLMQSSLLLHQYLSPFFLSKKGNKFSSFFLFRLPKWHTTLSNYDYGHVWVYLRITSTNTIGIGSIAQQLERRYFLPGVPTFSKNRVFSNTQYSGFEFFLRMQM